MGKIARSLAYVQEYTVDPLVTVGKGVGRGAKAVKNKVAEGLNAVGEEHADIEARKALRKQADEVAEQMAEQVIANAKAAAAAKKPARTAKVKPAKVVEVSEV